MGKVSIQTAKDISYTLFITLYHGQETSSLWNLSFSMNSKMPRDTIVVGWDFIGRVCQIMKLTESLTRCYKLHEFTIGMCSYTVAAAITCSWWQLVHSVHVLVPNGANNYLPHGFWAFSHTKSCTGEKAGIPPSPVKWSWSKLGCAACLHMNCHLYSCESLRQTCAVCNV